MLLPALRDVQPLASRHYLLSFNHGDDKPLCPGEYYLATINNITLYCPLLLATKEHIQAIVHADKMTQQEVEKHLLRANFTRQGNIITNISSDHTLFIFCQYTALAQTIFYLQQSRQYHQKIILIAETNQQLPFSLLPSKILLPTNPIQHMTGSIQLLEDWSVCARFCGIQQAGYGDCTISQLLEQWPDITQTHYPTNVLLAGNSLFIHHCKEKLPVHQDSISSYTLEI